jgi:hypothetical protein
LGITGGGGVYALNAGELSVAHVTTNARGSTFDLAGGSFKNGFIFQNSGQLNYSAGSFGPQASNSALVNDGIINLSGDGTRTIAVDVTNKHDGFIKSTNTTASFTGMFRNDGVYKSDPATNLYQDLINGETGVLQGGKGDVFSIAGNFINHALENTAWNTDLATLRFTGSGHHELDLVGGDLGPTPAGFIDNFAFGVLGFDLGAILDLIDGNSTPGAALYIRELDLPGQDLSRLNDIHSAFNVYYDEFDPANAYLGGLDFLLPGGGALIAATTTPEPASLVSLVSMLACLGLFRTVRKDQDRPES